MKSTRYSISRQKVCQQCSASKAKCDRSESGCSRCVQRGLTCIYPGMPCSPDSIPVVDERATRNRRTTTVESGDENAAPARVLPRTNNLQLHENHSRTDRDVSPPWGPTSAPRHVHDEFDELDINDFVDLGLICPINAESIANRWLGAYIPLPNQKVKKYPTAISTFLHQILKSYVTVTIRGRGYPPFIHAAQVTTRLIRPPLSTCLSLVRMCEHQLPGSEETTATVLQREMQNLFEHRETFDATTLLCAFQAYLIFTMVLFFRLGQISSPFLREAVMNLQEFACAAARRGLVCDAEQQYLRPKWESWIVAEANRRTLYTMYLFDGVLSAYDGLPTFVGTELSGLPAPANQTLWRAGVREQWNAAYNTFLADWSEGGLRIDELWPVPDHFGESDVTRRRNRVDRWLEGLDEYGTMLYAVTSCTHG
ncbi:hypothetical protein F5B22DRAFT_402196 [Xylaria bambusicola]|uniref:uncharacterized protein n=1 Tax=Xylaria bambusicola TaxID=326684 RepID=UPI0020082693|nr:uncharacterized protein F5B22DRAFT_402196 [Xylaria bambusicola]KAI0508361.1 hypothetical protein F5B22DRAFT_402196 [Xylaria bambusicola]